MINPWLQFIISAAVIVCAGSRLTKNAAIVADHIGIGTAWVGALMLPLATSLPELVTTLRAVTIDTPDLAVGNIFGSCLYNLALLALIDLLEGRGALTARVGKGHIVPASLSVISVCLASIAMLGITGIKIGWVSFETLLIAFLYFYGSRLLFKYEKKNQPALSGIEEPAESGNISGGRALLNFGIAALFIVAAGVLVTDALDIIAVETGLGHTFVGSLFLAVSTSLPETVTTVSAVRLGYLDMAVANVFGANFMNLFIIFIADAVYRRGLLLHSVTGAHLFSALLVILISTVIIFGLTYRSTRRKARVGPDTMLALAGYLLAMLILFRSGGNF
ncbi:MAG TPA: sodium:calcium antiporter [Firmicutes bacterium]|nr:sodium:calcium antiporter [Bacillota bacterium]